MRLRPVAAELMIFKGLFIINRGNQNETMNIIHLIHESHLYQRQIGGDILISLHTPLYPVKGSQACECRISHGSLFQDNREQTQD